MTSISNRISTLQKINMLKFTKDMKKDYYKSFPNTKTYKEIIVLISQIKYLESK